MHRFLTAAAAVFIGINAFLGGGSVSAQPSTYGDAMKWYEREAAKGTAKAQFLLGLLYERGAGPRGKDAAAAYGWFLKAAEQGYPRAEYKVGVALQFAIGTPADPDKAVTWYRRAAEHGVTEAQYNLAYMIENAVGPAQSPQEAAHWYRRAAEGGFGPAQLNLGYLYLRGAGVAASAPEAWAWFRAAESRGIEGAAAARAEVEAGLGAAELAEAKRLAENRVRR